MKGYLRFKAWLERNRDLGFELVRIYLGLGLFAKGVYFSTHVTDVLDLWAAHGLFDFGNEELRFARSLGARRLDAEGVHDLGDADVAHDSVTVSPRPGRSPSPRGARGCE